MLSFGAGRAAAEITQAVKDAAGELNAGDYRAALPKARKRIDELPASKPGAKAPAGGG